MAARIEVELVALDRGGEHLGGAERVGALEGIVGDEHGLGRTHRERGAQTRRLTVGGHRHEGHLALAGLVDKLQRHLDAVGVGVVEDELAGAVEVVAEPSSDPGVAGIGDLLYTDNDIHAAQCCR